MSLEKYFSKFRKNIIGVEQEFDSPFGKRKILYTDWTASGRLYRPIEEKLMNDIGPFVGNTHTETSITGCVMTKAYHAALNGIKKHVNANQDDVIISEGSGMTGVMIKFQRILGFKVNENYQNDIHIPEDERPVVFITHMEHHSNQTSWLETICDVEVINKLNDGEVDLDNLQEMLEQYKNRKTKIASITAASNVTGIVTPYHEIAKIMHQNGGLCFVDFACSAPYVEIDMHPSDPLQKLDAVIFSPHKFLGGPGTTGILIFCKDLYHNKIPDVPGGGTVDWTNPWGEHKYVDNIEAREDGGTPAFLQTIKTYFAIQLKEEMGVENILQREQEITQKLWNAFKEIPNLHLLAPDFPHRLGILSFYVDKAHHNLIVKLLNDHYGIQVRGGCSCAGTYGHFLLNVTKEQSHFITQKINEGDLSLKPGWIRLSVHPTITDEEVDFIIEGVKDVVTNFKEMEKDYEYVGATNDFKFIGDYHFEDDLTASWMNKKELV